MRIGVNIYLLQPHVGGIANYVLTFLREWPKLYPRDPIVLFGFEHNMPMLEDLPPYAKEGIRVLPHQEAILDHLDEIDVYFCPFGALWPRPFPKPSVVLVMDLQERFFPEFFDSEQWRARAFHYTWSLRMADRIIAISDFTKQTFVQLAGIRGRKISRVYLCADELPKKDKQPDLPISSSTAFAYYPANNWAHKNHARLFDAIRLLNGRGVSVPLLMTGVEVDGAPSLHEAIRERGLEGTVHLLGQRPRGEIAWLYRHARLLVNPSLFEGFGIPLVEAMQSGLCIVCSGTTSLPEIAGPAALYFDPFDAHSIAMQVERAWTDEDTRTALIREGYQRAALFTEEAAMRAQHAVFEHALSDFSPLRYQINHRVWRHVSRFWNLKPRPTARQVARARAMLGNRHTGPRQCPG